MKRTILTAILAALGILVAGWSWHGLRSLPISWQGRSLSFWLKEFDDNRRSAAQAVRQIGPAALPYLCDELRAHDPAWKVRLVALVRKQRLVNFHFTPAAQRRERAIQACRALGPLARPAIPALGEALGRGSGSALPVLEAFGPEVVTVLATALTNAPGCGPPWGTARALGRMGASARAAVTNLIWEFEHHSVGPPRCASAEAASDICRELIEVENEPYAAEVFHTKRALVRGLSSTNTQTQAYAACGLTVLGVHAHEAAPALTSLLSHPAARVRVSATNALQAVAPEEFMLAVDSQ